VNCRHEEMVKATIARQERDRKSMYQPFRTSRKLPRKNWKREYELERNRVLDEAIKQIRLKLRDPVGRPDPASPTGRTYTLAMQSVVTILETMKRDS
jgi:hypothetical protein